MNTREKFDIVLLWVIITLYGGCASDQGFRYGYGDIHKNLAYPGGRGTLIIFYTQNDDLSNKIRLDVGIVSDNYEQQLKIFLVDVIEKRNLAEKHRIEQVPTLILFDNLGREAYRWLPRDFESDFSSRDIERKIEKLPPP